VINFNRTSRRSKSIALNLTSLIDVLFLLVIFFLLTTRFVTSDSIDLSISTITEAQKDEKPINSAIVITLIDNNKFTLGGTTEYKIDELYTKVSQLFKTSPNKDVVLLSKAGVTVQNMVSVMDTLKISGATNISLGE
jgi:biopolymer transport protein ExbD